MCFVGTNNGTAQKEEGLGALPGKLRSCDLIFCCQKVRRCQSVGAGSVVDNNIL